MLLKPNKPSLILSAFLCLGAYASPILADVALDRRGVDPVTGRRIGPKKKQFLLRKNTAALIKDKRTNTEDKRLFFTLADRTPGEKRGQEPFAFLHPRDVWQVAWHASRVEDS